MKKILKPKWIAAASVVAAVQVVVACGNSTPAPSVAQATTNQGANILAASDLLSPKASWLVGSWTSETRGENEYRHVTFTADPRQMVYEWYNAQVGSDQDATLPPSPTYCSYRYTAYEFELDISNGVAPAATATPPNVATARSFGQPNVGMSQPFSQPGSGGAQPSVAQPFGQPTSSGSVYQPNVQTASLSPTDGILKARVVSVDLIDEASQDDPGCQMWAATERVKAQSGDFSFGFVRDRYNGIFQDGWTFKKDRN